MGTDPMNMNDKPLEKQQKPPEELPPYPEQSGKKYATPEDLAGELWDRSLEEYPLRPPDQDPRWAVRTVWIWTGLALFSLFFVLALIVLGAIFD